MAGRGSGAQHPGASLGVWPTNSGGTPANKGLAAPAIADGFHTPLSSLPGWANTGADPFKKKQCNGEIARKKGGVQWQAGEHAGTVSTSKPQKPGNLGHRSSRRLGGPRCDRHDSHRSLRWRLLCRHL